MSSHESRFLERIKALAGALALFLPSAAEAGDFQAWVQFASGGLEARAITQNSSCPRATIDGREMTMNPRARPDGAFPVLVCSLEIPRGAGEASIDGRRLALPPPRVDKILLIGDTGCRLRWPIMQACNSIEAWPFRLNAELGARFSPDLVIHVGDYLYRESACRLTQKDCAGSPWGDKWAAWRADFFDPARPLLEAAPWAFVRGNHEICSRAGRGWSRTLDAFPYPADTGCARRNEPFSVDLGGLTLVVLDVTEAEDRFENPRQAEIFAKEFESAGAIRGPVWLAFHKPIFTVVRTLGPFSIGDNKTLALAARKPFPDNVQTLLSGHLHTFQAASYVEDYPAQIVAGHGGDRLDQYAPPNFDGLVINGVTVERGRGATGVFGFAMLERRAEEWLLTAYDTTGKVLASCQLRGRKLACE